MSPAIRVLLNQILDYAGLFPPAKLSLLDALRTYLRGKKSPYQWMLGRFVCPIAQLAELADLARGHPEASHVLQVTALGKQADDAGAFVAQIEKDVKAIQSYCKTFGRRDAADMYEVALPNVKPLGTALAMMPIAAMELGRAGLPVFFEIPRTDTWRDDVDAACGLIADLRQMNATAGIGLKLRAGGLSAEAFPSNEQVASFLERCSAAKVPWKATAGLHHPRRHWDETLKVWHHGFLNVFIAGILAQVHSLSESDLISILADCEWAHVQFAQDTIRWNQWSCTTAHVSACRTGVATTFGSCSFEEPTADLLALNLFDAGA
jgi:hypothetical protein